MPQECMALEDKVYNRTLVRYRGVMNICYTTSYNRTLGYLILFGFQALSSKRHHSLWKVVFFIYI